LRVAGLRAAAASPAASQGRRGLGPLRPAEAREREGCRPGDAGNDAIQREVALRAAGLRAAAASPAALGAPRQSASRPDPVARAGCPSSDAGNDAMQSLPPGACPGGEPGAAPRLMRLTPTKALAPRKTTLAGTWAPGLASLLVPLFGHAVPEPGWRIPQAMPATGPVAAVVRSFMAAHQCHAEPATPVPPAGGRTPLGHLMPPAASLSSSSGTASP
jgi:hypothetical protein